MYKMYRFTLALALTSLLLGAPAAFAAQLEATDAAQRLGASSYLINLESEVKGVEVLDADGDVVATLEISFDGRDGALLDFETLDGTRLSVMWGDPEGGVAVSDRLTGEVVVLDAEEGENNQGEGIALIDRHRQALTLLGTLYADLDRQVFEGEFVPSVKAPADDSAFGSVSAEIWDPDPPCHGSQQLGFGTSFTANVPVAAARARQDANNKCTNQWCWGCCDFTRPPICRTVLFVTNCSAYGKRCSQPCV